MKQWEDIFKDKLEGYESGLPEGSLADFRARLEESRKPARRSGVRPWWFVALSAAAAACLALFFVLGNKETSVEPGNMVAEVVSVDSSVVDQLAEAVQDEADVLPATPSASHVGAAPAQGTISPLAQAKPAAGASSAAAEAAAAVEPEEAESAVAPEEAPESAEAGKAVEEKKPADEYSESPEAKVNIPSFPGPAATTPAWKTPARFKVHAGTAVRSVVGASAIGGVLASVGAFKPALSSSLDDDESGNHQSIRDPLLDTTYRHPVKVDASFRYAVTNRLYITSGVGYSQYSTIYNFTYRGKVSQVARYISVPLRVDYGIVQSRWIEVYLGAGGAADFCIYAGLDGAELEKEGTTYSLVGAAGVQLNITKRLGAFIEPQVSWAIPSEKRVLETYRYMHPVGVDVSTGLRFTFGKR